MPSITCTHCSAVLKTKDPVPPGKKVKCPKCGQPFVVGESSEEAAAPPSPADSNGGFQDEAPAPKKGKAPGKNSEESEGEDAPAKGKKGNGKKTNTGMIIGIVVGAVLLCCCCPTCVGGIFQAFEDTIKAALIGGAVKNAPKDIKK
jgi:phage FluMu protein Com